jgi:hypothetical protein
VDQATAVPFAGWLQLLGLLSSVLSDDPVALGRLSPGKAGNIA